MPAPGAPQSATPQRSRPGAGSAPGACAGYDVVVMAEIDGRAAPLATLAAEYELDDAALQALGPAQCASLLERIGEGCALYRVHMREGAETSAEQVVGRLGQAAAVLCRPHTAAAEGPARDFTFASDTPELELLQILEGTRAELERVPRRARLSRPPPATAISIRPAAMPAAVSAPSGLAPADRARSVALTPWVAGDVLPVEVQRLDRLVEVVGELGIVQSAIGNLVEKARAGAGSAELLCDAQRLQRSFERSACALRACALDARKVPMLALLEALAARGRAIAASSDKAVMIVVEDTALELDKQVADLAFEPLCKWLRHVVEDGIEAFGARAELGKPSLARIALRAHALGASQLLLEIDDDGAEIELERQRRTGAAHEVADLPDAAVPARPEPKSTDAALDDATGRAAEFARLRDALRALSSAVELAVESGRNRVAVSVPVTRALVSMLLVSVRGRPYLLPIANVAEVSRRTPGSASSGADPEPLDLGEWLSLPLAAGTAAPRHVVAVRHGARQLAVLVERAIAHQSVYLKPLGSNLGAVRAVSGAAELGDGRLALVLDPAALFDERA